MGANLGGLLGQVNQLSGLGGGGGLGGIFGGQQASPFTPTVIPNPSLSQALGGSGFTPQAYAAYSQNLPSLLFGTAGQRVGILSYPNTPAFTFSPGLSSFDGGLNSPTGPFNNFSGVFG